MKKEFDEEPVVIKLGNNKYKYGANCNVVPTATKSGMDAHIHSVHTKKPFLCGMCNFSLYNLDLLQ